MTDDVEFTDEQVGHTVLDAAGDSLGRLTALYTDADTRQVVFGGVLMLRRGRRRLVFVPLTGAVVDDDTITLRCGARLVRRAPNVQPGRALPVDAERGLYAHYDMAYAPPATAERRLLPALH